MGKIEESLLMAAEAIRSAEALVIAAGAGMGVDSGLPDFRGDEGFWRAYPPFKERGLRFVELANPRWFATDPELAWGFYGHRLNLYRTTVPHEGFGVLRRWVDRLPLGAFVFTSNVDGQFQKAGFDAEQIFEVHGSIHHLQSVTRGGPSGVWSAGSVKIEIDESTFRARQPLPRCPGSECLARPNVLMFGDSGWDSSRADEQERRYLRWRQRASKARLVVVELGAGTAVPTVRYESEQAADVLIRINPREPMVPAGGIAVPLGAREALKRLGQILGW